MRLNRDSQDFGITRITVATGLRPVEIKDLTQTLSNGEGLRKVSVISAQAVPERSRRAGI